MMEKVRLGDVCNILNGYAFKSSEYKESGIRVIRITNVQSGYIEDKEPKYYSLEKKTEIEKYMLKDNDILISLTGNVGRVGLLKREMLPAALNQRVACIRIKENKNISIDYIFNILNTKKFLKQCEINSKGIAQKNLSTEWLKNYLIDIPDFKEQAKISNNLDKVQNIIDLRKKQIEQLDKLSKSQFVEMFQSGNYPKDELGKLCDVRDGTHDSPKYLEKSGYKFITSKNIINNEIDFSEVKYISKQDYDKFNTRSKVNYGDILMPMIGTIGKPMIVNIPDDEIDFAIKNVALIKFLDNSQVTNIYIKNLFDSDYFENAILQNKRGGTQKFIALSDIRKMQIEIPPIELQNQFAYIVKQIDKQKFILEKSLKKLEEMQESLMNKYFE